MPRSVESVNLGTRTKRPLSWLWPRRIAKGMLTLIVGDPGVGKSYLTLDIIARVTTGSKWPHEEPGTKGVVILVSGEDPLEEVILPRLEAVGGDPRQVERVQGIRDARREGLGHLDLQRDMQAVEEFVTCHTPALIVIDPLSSYLGSVDEWRNNEVRGALEPVAALAERHGTAVIGVAHLNKAVDRKAIYRISGSIGFPGLARVVHLIVADDMDDERRLMLPIKYNLGQTPKGLAYRLAQVEDPLYEVARLEWEKSFLDLRADDALEEERLGDIAKAGVREAEELIRVALAKGPLAEPAIQAEARRQGISASSLRRAKARLGVVSTRRAICWEWELP